MSTIFLFFLYNYLRYRLFRVFRVLILKWFYKTARKPISTICFSIYLYRRKEYNFSFLFFFYTYLRYRLFSVINTKMIFYRLRLVDVMYIVLNKNYISVLLKRPVYVVRTRIKYGNKKRYTFFLMNNVH